MAVAEVTGKQEEVVGNRGLRAAPVGDPLTGERVPEIVQTRTRPLAIPGDTGGDFAEMFVHAPLSKRATPRSDEEMLRIDRMDAAGANVLFQRRNRRWMQWQQAFRTKF